MKPDIIPEFLKPELIHLEKRLNSAYTKAIKNRNHIDKNISTIQAMELYDFGIDPTQLKITP